VDVAIRETTIMRRARRQVVDLNACGPDDPDGQRAASLLAAYFNAEHARAFRQLVWRRLALGGVVAWLIEMTTPLLPRPGLLVALLAFGAAATAAAMVEWRAENTLRALIDSPPKGHRQQR
jgi:hypothetical protein